MLRDDHIANIKMRLDEMIKDENKKIMYEAILTRANHKMNLDVHVDEKGKHQVFWCRKVSSGTFDSDVADLDKYIEQIDSNI